MQKVYVNLFAMDQGKLLECFCLHSINHKVASLATIVTILRPYSSELTFLRYTH